MQSHVVQQLGKVPTLSGALLINKPEGITSYGVIEEIKKVWITDRGIRRKQLPKIGHGGTLDPFAGGLLVVLVGRACKLAQHCLGAVKHYQGTFLFGVTTLAGDNTGEITERSDARPASLEILQSEARKFTQDIYLQTPPMFSAKKHKGKPLYELARSGIEIEREPKACTLHEFTIKDFDGERASFDLVCTSGTYVRTLAQDLSRALGTVGLLESLVRVGSGPFRFDRTNSLTEVKSSLASTGAFENLRGWIPYTPLQRELETKKH